LQVLQLLQVLQRVCVADWEHARAPHQTPPALLQVLQVLQGLQAEAKRPAAEAARGEEEE
jgi:hypothetical protein